MGRDRTDHVTFTVTGLIQCDSIRYPQKYPQLSLEVGGHTWNKINVTGWGTVKLSWNQIFIRAGDLINFKYSVEFARYYPML